MLRGELYKPWWANETDWGIEILEGEFQGVVIQIESLEFPQDDSPNLNMAYHVISKPQMLEEDIEKSELFAATLNTVITDIIKEAINFYEQDRDNSTSESNQ